jgi:hypothetical protein
MRVLSKEKITTAMQSIKSRRYHCIVGTRIHASSSSPDLSQLRNWCESAMKYADTVVVATDDILIEDIRQILAPLGSRACALHVSPWKGFTIPLNAIVAEATSLGGDRLLLQSLEVSISPSDVQELHSYLTKDTLVVGAKLVNTQGGGSGTQPLDGQATPWNTLALWDLRKLYVTGFLGISSGLIPEVPGGIEEVPTISLLQQLYPNKARAKLVTLSGVEWTTMWDDETRMAYHRQKMSTKYARAEIQLKHLGLPRGQVEVYTKDLTTLKGS